MLRGKKILGNLLAKLRGARLEEVDGDGDDASDSVGGSNTGPSEPGSR